MEKIKVLVFVDERAAIKAGKTEHGQALVTIDPAQLTPLQRDTLAGCSSSRFKLDDCLYLCPQGSITYPIADATFESVILIIDALAAKKEEEKRVAEAKHEKLVLEFLDAPITKFLNFCEKINFSGDKFNVATTDIPKNYATPNFSRHRFNTYCTESEASAVLHDAHTQQKQVDIERFCADHNEAAAKLWAVEVGKRQAALDAYVNDPDARPVACDSTPMYWLTINGYGRIERDHPRWSEILQVTDERLAADELERVAVDQAADERRRLQLAAWINQHGTDNQKKRWALSLLPITEIIDGMRSEAFIGLAGFPRYEKLNSRDVLCSCYSHSTPVYDAYLATEATAEEFDTLERITTTIQADFPEATVTLRTHEAYCAECYNKDDEGKESDSIDYTVYRKSAKVELTVGEFSFSREYQIP